MYAVSLTLALALAGAIYLYLKRHYSYWAQRNVLHEKPVFLLGNMKGIGSKYHWKDINQRLYKQFRGEAPFIGIYTFMTRALYLIDLDLIKQILVKDFNHFSNRGAFHNVRDDPLTGNLLFLDGEQWRVLRHKLSPVFTTGKLRYMFPTMISIGEHLTAACKAVAEQQQNGEFEAKELCARYTIDVIGRCAFGIECNSLKDPAAKFLEVGRSIAERPRHSLAVQGFMFNDPELARKLRMKMFTDEVSEFYMNVVRDTVEYRERNNVKRKDFMDMLIELKAQRDQCDLAGGRGVDDLSNGLTLEQVAAQALLFFLAGFETSSTTMSFCLYELALNTEIQETLRAEIREAFEKHNGELTYESIKEMTYLEKVISETLRKYSVIPHLIRQSVNDYKVPNSDVILEKGTRIFIPIDSIHHDPELYAEPEKFKPERFTPEEIAKRHPFAYLPFGDGPRNCIGMRFGKMQAKIGIIALLREFRFNITEHTEIPMRFARKSFIIAAENGIHLSVEKL